MLRIVMKVRYELFSYVSSAPLSSSEHILYSMNEIYMKSIVLPFFLSTVNNSIRFCAFFCDLYSNYYIYILFFNIYWLNAWKCNENKLFWIQSLHLLWFIVISIWTGPGESLLWRSKLSLRQAIGSSRAPYCMSSK